MTRCVFSAAMKIYVCHMLICGNKIYYVKTTTPITISDMVLPEILLVLVWSEDSAGYCRTVSLRGIRKNLFCISFLLTNVSILNRTKAHLSTPLHLRRPLETSYA